jgi:transposase
VFRLAPNHWKEARMFSIGIDTHARVHAVCVLDVGGVRVQEFTVKGGVAELVDALRERVKGPFRACYEASLGYGVLFDALVPVAAKIVVAHPARLRAIATSRRKNDRVDAQRLARYLFLGEVPSIHVPDADVRAWRGLIEHRRRLVDKRTAAKNGLRAVLRSQGIHAPSGKRLWTKAGRAWIVALGFASALTGLRRDQLLDEVARLDAAIRRAERELDVIAEQNKGVALLRTIPGVGPRTAEAVVAWVDVAERFKSTRRAASYFGLVPSLDESAAVKRYGRITKEGPATVRRMLVEASWRAVALNPPLRQMFERVRGGKKDRTGRALVAVAHRLLRIMVSMLKSGEPWRPPEDKEECKGTAREQLCAALRERTHHAARGRAAHGVCERTPQELSEGAPQAV